MYGEMIFNQDTRTIQRETTLISCIKMNSRCIIDQNLKARTVLVKETMEMSFVTLGQAKIS